MGDRPEPMSTLAICSSEGIHGVVQLPVSHPLLTRVAKQVSRAPLSADVRIEGGFPAYDPGAAHTPTSSVAGPVVASSLHERPMVLHQMRAVRAVPEVPTVEALV